MILCGERIGAEQAQSIGLVEEVVAQGESLNRALMLAEQSEKQSGSQEKERCARQRSCQGGRVPEG